MEGISQPRQIAWYMGTPHQDILNTIRLVSLLGFDTEHLCFQCLRNKRQNILAKTTQIHRFSNMKSQFIAL